MTRKTLMLVFSCYAAITVSAQSNDRQLWLQQMDKMARPVIVSLAEGKLKEKMPVELTKTVDDAANRTAVSYLEAFGRTLSGIAPWLNLEGGSSEEAALRQQYRQWTLKVIANAVNPASKDYLKWNCGKPWTSVKVERTKCCGGSSCNGFALKNKWETNYEL